MMQNLLTGMAVFLMANLVVGLLRVHLGPTPADRMLSMLLFGTTTVATMLLLAYAQAMPALVIVALVFVMLATIGSIAFVQLPPRLKPTNRNEKP
ncbi:monovalent cation/H+ antiporter complex subunit F [Natronospira bacteriovora]|uniref:Monovalent cation/H+ antiporter complex subunit F n=1 Tax=Natronospira bacteriovora TaxID=3069753 RepID=A0ABU0W9U9_9GAMM|nr:monovalent cation/H+ antiporter complex subunit F [Natronospira sp. AB-CW4]MDQ2070688.1 monovalent cation/H+ antiporter complex subunit F [Natronospira sp. AB-CW4]